MSNLVCRDRCCACSRRCAALVLGASSTWLAIGPLGATASVELALLCWLSGAAFILLVETSPI